MATAWDPSANGDVHALAVSGSTVYAGGGFSIIGGLVRSRIAALNAVSGSATAWNPNANNWIDAIAIDDSTVYAGGQFGNIGGQTRSCLAALDANGNATAWNPDPGKYINAIALSASTVCVGGDFQDMGAVIQPYFARFIPQPHIDSIAPSMGKSGTEVTIDGTDFGVVRDSSYVSFGGAKATSYTSWSDTSIKCKVPAGAPGQVKVRVTTPGGTSNGVDFEVINTWYLAEGSTDGGMETWVLVQNPNATDVTVDLTFMTGSGSVPGPQDFPIAGNSRTSFNVGTMVTDFNVSTQVNSSGGNVICERAMYGPGRMWAHDSIGYAP